VMSGPTFEFNSSQGNCTGSCKITPPATQCGDGCYCEVQWAGRGACRSSTK
ncbi:unnamed protein product, partial [Adineta steineri]